MKNIEPLDAVLIAGPTASGKSELGMIVAERLGGTIINSDSMQVYKGLSVLTARPSAADEARVRHALYGFVEPSQAFSVGDWTKAATQKAMEVSEGGGLPIFLGGTGLYLSVLSDGISPVPEVPEGIRTEVRNMADAKGLEALFQEVLAIDPILAERVGPTDSQRLMRALEVFHATGEPLSEWQKRPKQRPFEGRFARIVLEPDRQWVYDRIESRVDRMMGSGALDEVKALTDLELAPDLPVMKALGVQELVKVHCGEKSMDEAVRDIKTQTRRFAKRQLTWFRNQMIAWNRVSAQQMEKKIDDSFTLIMNSGLTSIK
jgi:tRNA dimethylallyltransferase